jgi:hypothetical protein
VLDDDAVGSDGVAEVAGDPAGGDGFEEDEEGVQQDDGEAGLVVEDAGREPDPEEGVVQHDGDSGGEDGRDAAEDDKHGDHAEDLEVGLDEAVGDVNGEGGDTHGGDREGDGSEIAGAVAKEEQAGAEEKDGAYDCGCDGAVVIEGRDRTEDGEMHEQEEEAEEVRLLLVGAFEG